MFRFSLRLSRRAAGALALGATLTISAAGAATLHRFGVTQGTGSLGATTFLQNNASSSALQGEVASTARTNISIPFGVLGEYDAPGSKFGSGMLGISTTGYGVAGESLGNNPSVIGYSGGGATAIEGVTPPTSSAGAITGIADGTGSGGSFQSMSNGDGIDVFANSSNHTSSEGMYVQNDSTVSSTVYAVNAGPTATPAYLYEAAGVYASANGAAVYAQSTSDAAIVATTSCDYAGVDMSDASGLKGGVCAGLYVVQAGAGYPLLVHNPSTDTYPLYLDTTGNLTTEGMVSATQFVSRGTDARSGELTYGAKQTESTVEDFGRATLANGGATVALRSDYLATIDSSAPYMVFLTPHGENHGLYVSAMNARGFEIRESFGGRSNLAFDYRIVAKPAGTPARRLPHESQIAGVSPRAAAGRGIGLATLRANDAARDASQIRSHRRPAAAVVPLLRL